MRQTCVRCEDKFDNMTPLYFCPNCEKELDLRQIDYSPSTRPPNPGVEIRGFGIYLQAAAEELLSTIDKLTPRNPNDEAILAEIRRLLNNLIDGAMALKRL